MKMRKFLPYLVVVFLAGCTPVLSLHPLYTEETITFEEKLLGIWIADPNEPGATVEFARLEADAIERLPAELRDQVQKCYRTNIIDKGRKGSFVACLVKLQDRLFLDIWPDKFPSDEQDPNNMKLAHNAFFFLPVHIFARVSSIGDQVKVRLLVDVDKGFKKLLKAAPKAVEYTTLGEQLILTASTPELQTFVTKYANDERLFPTGLTLNRKSK
jgi:hypothetical protein